MNILLAEQLKRFRADKKVSQEKLAQYLNVSPQAVSKWENEISYPDISLLPEIARFFGVSVDELLCVEKIDEARLFEEYSAKAFDFYRCGDTEKALAVWQEAYKQMPNNIDVKEMLMSAYFDTDKVSYFNEFYDLAMDIYNGSSKGQSGTMYYKGQAIRELARTFAERGDIETALQWAHNSVSIFNSKEIIEASIDKGEDLLNDVTFCTYWFLEELYYLVCYIHQDEHNKLGDKYWRDSCEVIAQIYETIYKNDDMGYEQLQHLCNLHQGIAEFDAMNGSDETLVRKHIERSLMCSIKSSTVTTHTLSHPMLYGLQVIKAPSDEKSNLRFLKDNLKQELYDAYREKDWFVSVESTITDCLKS